MWSHIGERTCGLAKIGFALREYSLIPISNFWHHIPANRAESGSEITGSVRCTRIRQIRFLRQDNRMCTRRSAIDPANLFAVRLLSYHPAVPLLSTSSCQALRLCHIYQSSWLEEKSHSESIPLNLDIIGARIIVLPFNCFLHWHYIFLARKIFRRFISPTRKQ